MDNLTQRHSGTENTEKKALELIARAEQCSAGLARKLEMRGHKSEDVTEVISKLIEQNLINDERYARLWLHTRVKLTRTPRRLLIGLMNKSIPRDLAQSALESVLDEETELAMLKRFAKKHTKKGDGLKYLLKAEGFSKEVISQFNNSRTISSLSSG